MRWGCILVLATACGSLDDVDETSAALDAPIRVTVYKYGGDPTGAAIVEPNIRVDFVAPDATRQTVITDASGIAEATSAANTTVIVYQTGERDTPLFRSYEAVNPGDDIVVDRAPRQSFPPLGDITFALPRRGPQTAGYELHVSCGGFGGTWPEPVRTISLANCPFATDATVVGWAVDANGAPITGPSVLSHVDLTTRVGTTVHMPGYESRTSSVSGQFSAFPASSFASWTTIYYNGDDPALLASAFVGEPTLAGTSTAPIAGVGNRTLSVLQFTPDTYSSVRLEDVVDARVSQLTATGTEMIRPIGIPTYDIATQTASWSNASFGQPATIAHVVVRASLFGQTRLHIDMFAPGDASSLQLAPLPAEYQPQPGDSVTVSVELMSIGGESYTDSMELAATRLTTAANQWVPHYAGRIWRTMR